MSTTPIFLNGKEASAAAFQKALLDVQNLGSDVLRSLNSDQIDTLISFNVRLEAINARRTRAARVTAPEQAVKFVVSDFTDINQANTVATVRADSAVVSLKERAVPAKAVIQSNTFSANIGSIEALDSAQTIMRVSTFDRSIPTGTFNITLVTALTLNQFIIDTVASPSTPSISVSVSSDGLTFTPATRVAVSGFVVNVWLPSTLVKYIKVQITPAMPDELNGNSFTFGITDFNAQATEYFLRSDFMSKVVQFSPKSEFVIFNAEPDPNIQYYMAVWIQGQSQAPFVEINSGDAIHIGTAVDSTVTTSIGNPSFLSVISDHLYPSTLVVREGGIKARVALGLSPEDPNIASLQDEYVTVIPGSIEGNLVLLRANGMYNAPRTFDVSYVYGPPLVNVQLKVRLTTNNAATTPIFTGASLDEK